MDMTGAKLAAGDFPSVTWRHFARHLRHRRDGGGHVTSTSAVNWYLSSAAQLTACSHRVSPLSR